MTAAELLEWSGSVTGIAGAILMASKTRFSSWAYLIWLVSSIALTLFGLLLNYHGLALQQAVYTAVNLLGFWRWVVASRRPAITNTSVSSA